LSFTHIRSNLLIYPSLEDAMTCQQCFTLVAMILAHQHNENS